MRISAGVLVVFCACLLTACFGGGSKRLSAADYGTKLAAIGKEADASESGAEQALKAKTISEVASRLKTFADAADRIGNEVGKLKPPKNAQAANDELAKGEHDVADATKAVVSQVEKAATVKAALTIIQRSETAAAAGQEIDHALGVLKKLGYAKGS